jgi:hypothetical protein
MKVYARAKYQGTFTGEETSIRNEGKKRKRMAPHLQLAGLPL